MNYRKYNFYQTNHQSAKCRPIEYKYRCLTPKKILDIVSSAIGIPCDDMTRRFGKMVQLKTVTTYLICEYLPNVRWHQIVELYGITHHTSVMSQFERANDLYASKDVIFHGNYRNAKAAIEAYVSERNALAPIAVPTLFEINRTIYGRVN